MMAPLSETSPISSRFTRKSTHRRSARHSRRSGQTLEELMAVPSVIIDGFLYLGSRDHAADLALLRRLNITHIINVTQEVPNYFSPEEQPDNMEFLNKIANGQPAFKYLKCPCDDSKNDARLLSHFNPMVEFINQAKEKDGVVFVHCLRGISRSAASVIAYLMSTRQHDLRDACMYVKKRRTIIAPNVGFFEQLILYEQSIYGSSTLVSSDYSKFFSKFDMDCVDFNLRDSAFNIGPKNCVLL